MQDVVRGLWSWLLATTDFVFGFGGVAIVAYPTFRVAHELLGAAFPRALVPLLTFVVAFGASYPYVAGDWSLGRLGEFLFAVVVGALGWGVLVAGVVQALALESTPGDPAVAATAWTLALATAYGVVYWREARLFD